MINIMIAISIFLTEVAKCLIFFKYYLKEDFKRFWSIPVSFILYIIMLYFGLPEALSAIVVCVITLFFMTQQVYGKIILGVVILDSIAEIIMIFVRKVPIKSGDSLSDGQCYLFTNVIVVISLLLLKQLQNIKSMRNIRISSNIIYVTLGGVAWFMTLSVALLQYMQQYVQNKIEEILIDLFSMVAFFSVFIVVFMVLHIYYLNERLKEAYHLECSLKEAQEAYYKILLDKEEETRKYRHDLSNHMICLKQIVGQGQLEDVKTYIDSMYQNFDSIKNKVYDTGNDIFNIMLNHYLGMDIPNLKFRITGKITKRIDADNFTLCTIFSNILQNAIEELNRNHGENVLLWIKISNGDSNVKIQICNNSVEKDIKSGKIETQKPDKENHGIGLKNVTKAITECHGMLELDYADGMFIADIYLPYEVEE